MDQSQWILENRGPEEASRSPCPQTSCLLDFFLPLSHPYSRALLVLSHLLQVHGVH